jgi:hypothetical protein
MIADEWESHGPPLHIQKTEAERIFMISNRETDEPDPRPTI